MMVTISSISKVVFCVLLVSLCFAQQPQNLPIPVPSIPSIPALSSFLNSRTCPCDGSYPRILTNETTRPHVAHRKSFSSVLTFPLLGGMGGFDSYEIEKDESKQIDVMSGRLLATPLTPPTVCFAYFEAEENFKQVSTNVSNFDQVMSVGAFSIAVSMIIDSIFEYVDVNRNQMYDPQVDKVVGNPIDLSNVRWDRMCENGLVNSVPHHHPSNPACADEDKDHHDHDDDDDHDHDHDDDDHDSHHSKDSNNTTSKNTTVEEKNPVDNNLTSSSSSPSSPSSSYAPLGSRIDPNINNVNPWSSSKGYVYKIFNMTTLPENVPNPFMFSIQTEFASAAGVTSIRRKIVTPDSVKIDIKIENFPYRRNDTYIAINTLTVAGTSKFETDVTLVWAGSTIVAKANQSSMFLQWESKANHDGIDTNFQASGFLEAKQNELKGLAGSLYFVDRARTSNLELRRIYFSSSIPNARSIYWDPTIGIGVPQDYQEAPPMIHEFTLFMLILTIIGIVIFSGGMIFYIQQKKRRDGYVAIVPNSDNNGGL